MLQDLVDRWLQDCETYRNGGNIYIRQEAVPVVTGQVPCTIFINIINIILK